MNPTPGTVTTTSPFAVRLDGSSTPIPARRIASYNPSSGDRVAVVPFGAEVLVLGRVT